MKQKGQYTKELKVKRTPSLITPFFILGLTARSQNSVSGPLDVAVDVTESRGE